MGQPFPRAATISWWDRPSFFVVCRLWSFAFTDAIAALWGRLETCRPIVNRPLPQANRHAAASARHNLVGRTPRSAFPTGHLPHAAPWSRRFRLPAAQVAQALACAALQGLPR
jgi:hypothetical protein